MTLSIPNSLSSSKPLLGTVLRSNCSTIETSSRTHYQSKSFASTKTLVVNFFDDGGKLVAWHQSIALVVSPFCNNKETEKYQALPTADSHVF